MSFAQGYVNWKIQQDQYKEQQQRKAQRMQGMEQQRFEPVTGLMPGQLMNQVPGQQSSFGQAMFDQVNPLEKMNDKKDKLLKLFKLFTGAG